MSLPTFSVSPQTSEPEKHENRSGRHSQRWQTILGIVLLLIGIVSAWQLLNKQQNSMQAGRPLSYPSTHLHTVVVGNRPGMVYLGTHYGLFTSTDGGRSWPQSQGDLNTSMVTAIAVSPTNPDLLAVLAIPNSGLGRQAGIYLSSDAGKTWHFTLPANLPTTAYPYSIVGGMGAQGRFYAFFSYAGWFETRDLGQHWYAITSGDLAHIATPSLLSDPNNPEHVLMGGDQGLFETYNDGQSWQQIDSVKGGVVALSATSPTSGRARTIFCATEQGLYRWQDGQNTITQLPNPASATTPPTRVVVSGDGSALYTLSDSDLWFSENLGASWTKRWHFAQSDIIALTINPGRPTELLAGFFSPGLVLISNNAGQSWQTLTN